MQETVDEIDGKTETAEQNTEPENKPEKKKGFFGRLFK